MRSDLLSSGHRSGHGFVVVPPAGAADPAPFILGRSASAQPPSAAGEASQRAPAGSGSRTAGPQDDGRLAIDPAEFDGVRDELHLMLRLPEEWQRLDDADPRAVLAGGHEAETIPRIRLLTRAQVVRRKLRGRQAPVRRQSNVDPQQNGQLARTDTHLLDAGDVAQILGVPKSWVYAETRAGRLPHVNVGRYRRYRRTILDAWIADRERTSVAVSTADARLRSARS